MSDYSHHTESERGEDSVDDDKNDGDGDDSDDDETPPSYSVGNKFELLGTGEDWHVLLLSYTIVV